MNGRRVLACAATLALAGCAMVRTDPLVDTAAAPRGDVGYVAAAFWVNAATETYTFVLVDGAGHTHDMAFRDLTPPKKTWFDPAERGNESNGYPLEETNHLGMIALPPGDYRVAYWRRGMYGNAASPLPVKEASAIARPFEVRAGQVAFLGRFRAREDRFAEPSGWVKIVWSIYPDGPPVDEAKTLLRSAYPAFAEAPLECIACTGVPERPKKRAAPAPRQPGVFSL